MVYIPFIYLWFNIAGLGLKKNSGIHCPDVLEHPRIKPRTGKLSGRPMVSYGFLLAYVIIGLIIGLIIFHHYPTMDDYI